MKVYTTIEQSKKLAEFLPLESADMYYYKDNVHAMSVYHPNIIIPSFGVRNMPNYGEGDIPCWSLAALLDVLPKGTNISTPKPFNALGYCCWNQYYEIYKDNLVDACYEMIIKLNELKIL